jgi:hypothetical protein
VTVHQDETQERELTLLREAVDPLVQDALAAAGPWDAYSVAIGIPSTLVEALDWLPHGGRLYTGWSELTDLFETGKTKVPTAHAVLQGAANAWLAASPNRTSEALEAWLTRTEPLIRHAFERDGSFWSDPTG